GDPGARRADDRARSARRARDAHALALVHGARDRGDPDFAPTRRRRRPRRGAGGRGRARASGGGGAARRASDVGAPDQDLRAADRGARVRPAQRDLRGARQTMTPSEVPGFWESWFLWRDPLAVAIIAAALCAFVGVYIVLKRIVFVSAAMSQASGVG